MRFPKPFASATLLLVGAILLASGCVVEPREGYYDHEHHRWYHEHAWVVCHDRDEHCHD